MGCTARVVMLLSVKMGKVVGCSGGAAGEQDPVCELLTRCGSPPSSLTATETRRRAEQPR